ncbi:MAG: hypothetical protein F4X36_14065 [Gammaproteobacteria bacterium]|nr:hypothetical protein [Gammaproteobacteria bacterium]
MPYSERALQLARQRAGMRALRAQRRAEKGLADEDTRLRMGKADMSVPAWIERFCLVPTGPLQGQPFRVPKWQRRFLKEALAPGIREAGLSVARKNGKSGLIAAMLLACLRGPLASSTWRGVVASMSGRLATELREAIRATANLSGIQVNVKQTPPPGVITTPAGPRLDILAADKATGHALGADLVIVDEAGLMPENQRPLWEALMTCVSGRNGRLVAISIQGDGPMFRELKLRADDPTVCWHEYSTDGTEDFTDEAVWHRANPGLADGIKSIEYMRDMARRAAATPAVQSTFRAYDLNAPQSPSRELLVTMQQWQSVVVDQAAPRAGWCVMGFDLGGSSSMTAAAAYWPESGRLEVRGAFPGVPDIEERGRQDAVGNRYARMEMRGELKVYPGVRTTPVQAFLRDFLEGLRGEDIKAIVADRYREAEALDVFEQCRVLGKASLRGVGWKDASHDVRAFQRAVIDRHLQIEENLLLESAIMESALATDPAGNQKLDKARSEGRIDAATAATLAVGEAERRRTTRKRRYRGAA